MATSNIGDDRSNRAGPRRADRTADSPPDLSFVTGPIDVVGCHAAGEVGDVIVGGVAPPPGGSIWEQSRWLLADGRLRSLMLNEPRGGVFRHVNLLVPPVDPTADIGFVIMEPEDNPPMSGSNSICVATVALETGIVEMTEPTTVIRMEAPAGVVEATATCRAGKVIDVTIRNVRSFVVEQDASLVIDGRTVRVDTAFGGDSFVMVDAADLGVELVPENGRHLAELGNRLTAAANEQLTFTHPTVDWQHFSFCQIAGPLLTTAPRRHEMTNTVVVRPGKLDRSPTGTGVSARLALLHAQGRFGAGDELHMHSIIGSTFVGRIAETTTISDGNGDHDGDGRAARAAIVPTVTGSAWRTGRTQFEIDPSDPWPLGYRVSDTWPRK